EEFQERDRDSSGGVQGGACLAAGERLWQVTESLYGGVGRVGQQHRGSDAQHVAGSFGGGQFLRAESELGQAGGVRRRERVVGEVGGQYVEGGRHRVGERVVVVAMNPAVAQAQRWLRQGRDQLCRGQAQLPGGDRDGQTG